ncbi:MAG: tetratricopeptide repeat protein [Alphaproteobacteria bacterium]|nr:tetratricopeptide repeat protein [Alphaproteobacteria bacterium]
MIVSAASAASSGALAVCNYDLNGVPYPSSPYDHCPYRGRAAPAVQYPTGPSPEELQRQAEQKDLDEAAQDADDKGVAAYRKNDWATALNYFREAMKYAPDDADIRSNYLHAQAKVNEAHMAEIGRQMKSVEVHSNAAAATGGEAGSEEARKGFDTPGKDAGALVVSGADSSANVNGDPVVPPTRRTPVITALEKKRSVDRKQISVIDDKLKAMDPEKEPVKVAELKQEKSTIENKIHYLNFSISAKLGAPDPKKQVGPNSK